MPERPIGVEDVAPGAGVAEYRTRERSVGPDTVAEQYLVWTRERVPSCRAFASTFRIVGVTAANQNLAALFNKAGSGVLVAIRHLSVEQEFAGTSGSMRTFGLYSLGTAPTTGTLHTPSKFDTDQTQSSLVEFRGAASADGVASAITATAGAKRRQGFYFRYPSAIMQVQMPQALSPPMYLRPVWPYPTHERAGLESLPDPYVFEDPPFLLEGQGVLVQNELAGSTSTHFVVNACWEEFALP